MKLSYFLVLVLSLVSSSLQASEDRMGLAKKLTIQARKHFESLRFYPGGSYAKQSFKDAVNGITFARESDRAAWTGFLYKIMTLQRDVPDFDKRSEAWIKAYISYLIHILKYVQPIVFNKRRECQEKYSSNSQRCPVYQPFDNWRSLKAYEQ